MTDVYTAKETGETLSLEEVREKMRIHQESGKKFILYRPFLPYKIGEVTEFADLPMKIVRLASIDDAWENRPVGTCSREFFYKNYHDRFFGEAEVAD